MIQEQITVQPIIAAGRFDLRPLRKSDSGLMSLYLGDARVATGTRTVPHPLPPGAAEAMVARAMGEKRDSDVWAMDGSAQGLAEVLGLVTLTPHGGGQSEVSCWGAPAFWNTGFASEAVNAVVAANPHGSRTLFAEVFQDNPASARVLTNAGFQYLGDAECFSVARAATVPTWTYTRKMG